MPFYEVWHSLKKFEKICEKVSRHKDIILRDPMAEKIWNEEAFQIKGKSKSKWLCYNMAMRARVFDDWTRQMLNQHVSI